MKPINKILNRPDQVLGNLTKQALLNKYYTKIIQKYLDNPLDTDTFVTGYKNGVLTIATPYNEKLTLLKYTVADLIKNLRTNSYFIGLVTIKTVINPNNPQNLYQTNKNQTLSKTKFFLSDQSSNTLNKLANSIKHSKLQKALLKLSKNIK